MEIYLAIDYGTERVGLARSFGTLAEPLKIVPNNPHLMSELLNVIADEGITQIVVGVSENTMAQKSHDFAEELKKFTNLPIQFTDETLSSAMVHRKLHDRNHATKKPQHRQPIDHLAAAEFLQEFLDDHASLDQDL